MMTIFLSITATVLTGGLVVSAYFLYLFRMDQIKMRRVVLALITELRTYKERTDLQSKAIESVRRDFDLKQSASENESTLADAIIMAQQGATVEELEMSFKISRSEAAILVSSHGNLDLEERERVNQLYLT